MKQKCTGVTAATEPSEIASIYPFGFLLVNCCPNKRNVPSENIISEADNTVFSQGQILQTKESTTEQNPYFCF